MEFGEVEFFFTRRIYEPMYNALEGGEGASLALFQSSVQLNVSRRDYSTFNCTPEDVVFIQKGFCGSTL